MPPRPSSGAGDNCGITLGVMRVDDESARVIISDANDRFLDALRRADAAEMAECYTSHAVISPLGAEDLRGRAEIAADWRHQLGQGLSDARLEIAEVFVDGAVLIEIGTVDVEVNRERAFSERYWALWLEEDGRWRIHRQIWNMGVELTPDT